MTNSSQPLSIQRLPKFSHIKPEHIKSTIEQAVSDCNKTLHEFLYNNQ
jgi:Zn-dependent oligopeptidase